MVFSTTIDPDCFSFPAYQSPKENPCLPANLLSEQDIERAIEPEVRQMIEATQARFSNLCLQISFCFSTPKEVRVKRLIEDKRTILVAENTGNLKVGYPSVRVPRTSYRLEESVRKAVIHISSEVSNGRDMLEMRKGGWCHIYCFFSDYRLSGVRLALDMKVTI